LKTTRWLSPWVYGVSYLTGGWTPVLDVIGALAKKRLDVNLLMVLAAAGAAIIGDWGEGAALLFLFSLSGALEKFTLERTARSISALIELRPDTALVLRDGAEVRGAIDDIQPGEKVRVQPGGGWRWTAWSWRGTRASIRRRSRANRCLSRKTLGRRFCWDT